MSSCQEAVRLRESQLPKAACPQKWGFGSRFARNSRGNVTVLLQLLRELPKFNASGALKQSDQGMLQQSPQLSSEMQDLL